jgi:hypothetical protein
MDIRTIKIRPGMLDVIQHVHVKMLCMDTTDVPTCKMYNQHCH